MLRRMLLAAIAAGLIAGALITLVQMITTMPLIHHAEVYEARGSLQTGARGHATDPQATADQDELERLLFTGLANLLAGVGFGLILVACLALYGRPIDRSQGVCWGLAGFAVFTLAPALGLPPEAPGGMTADLADRQAWWIFAGAAAACGLGLLRFGKAWPWRLVGIGALILPHLVGAPTPERFGGGAPPELTARFAATSIAVSAIFWALLGWLTAVFYERSQNARHPDQPGWREDPSRPSRFRREWPVGGDPVRREFSGLIDRCGCGVSSLSAHHQCARATPPQRKCRSVQCPSKRLFSPSKPRHAWLKPLVACAERLDGQAAR